MQRNPWLSPGEAAERLGDVTASGVRWLMDTRRVRGIRTLSGRRLISASDLERLAEERRKRGPTTTK